MKEIAEEIAEGIAHLLPSGIREVLNDPGLAAPERAQAFNAAVARRLAADSILFIEGVKAYAAHPARRTPTPSETIWSEGPAKLLDYGPAKDAATVLLVPSLVNRPGILDLDPDVSLVRALQAGGLRPVVMDWGDPVGDARQYTLMDYIERLLLPALAYLNKHTGGPVPVAGYCMGGNLALAAAVSAPDHVQRLALMATPWDFHAGSAAIRQALGLSRPSLESLLNTYGAAPVDLLQAMFAALDPMLVGRKFRKFARMDQNSGAARRFVIMEDWLNDGVEVAGPVAHECLFQWYSENTPLAGNWQVGGKPVNPAAVQCESLVMIPASDRIVPPESAQALAGRLPDARVRTVQLGHIGMMASSRARAAVHDPLAKWLATGAM